MISFEKALHQIMHHTPSSSVQTIPLTNAQGYVLSTDISSPIDFPSFRQSAMDGYAMRKKEMENKNTLPDHHTIQAGDTKHSVLNEGEAMRIFTGAPVPEGADIVVMQEWIHQEEHMISLNQNHELFEGMNIRPIGSQNKKGETVMHQGEVLTPAAISFLSGLGITHMEVYAKPRVALLTTGKELIPPGMELQYGQIFESNSYGLMAALQQLQIRVTTSITCDDDLHSILQNVNQLLSTCDILLITGGVSVGDYDFVTTAMQQAQVETLFHKVKQKPGKPFYFGKKNQQLIFGLPGNPGSVMTCFYLYVYPAMRITMGHKIPSLPCFYLPVKEIEHEKKVYAKKKGLTHFIKAHMEQGQVTILSDQESYKMNSFAKANAMVILDEEKEDLCIGETVQTLLLPF